MSFGWSAGDIAAAIKLAHGIYEALDSCHGAAKEYREAVSFLKELTQTLKPLEAFATWGAYPAYGKEITVRVDFIKGPVENFLQEIGDLEPSLGRGAMSGRLRHIVPKLTWHIRISKRVLDLRNQIESHLRILDTLLQRLTLDVVLTTQRSLPDVFVSAFQDRIRNELIDTLQNMLVARGYHQDSCPSISPELLQKLLLGIRDLKEMVADPRAMQRRLEACFTPSGRITGPPSSGHRYLTSIGELEHPSIVGATRTRVGVSQHTAAVHGAVPRESLQEVYYLVLLYLGQFLKNLFSLLSRYVQPSRDLGQQLLAKFNLTLLDAVGSPPRILPSEIFQSFKVFRVFVQEQFKGIPLIDRGRFLLLSEVGNIILDEGNWSRHATQGSTVTMAALLLGRMSNRCPGWTCSGTLTRSSSQVWAKCTDCQREVFTAGPETTTETSDGLSLRLSLPSDSRETLCLKDPENNYTTQSRRPAGAEQSLLRHPKGNLTDDVENGSIFKRIVRRVGVSDSSTDTFFDWEEGKVKDFWKLSNHAIIRNKSHIPRMADEYCKLIEAVSRIHDDRPSIHIRPHDDTTTCGTKSNVLLYGRHGDIKPSNVLLAESTQRLVLHDFGLSALYDFGLSALQSTLSKEEQSGLRKFQMMTYRAPEFDVKEGIVSRCSDVYGMACLFLEHITLFLMGEDGVREFTSARLAEDQKLGWKKADVFYTVSEDLQTATLKKEVKDWIEQLRRQPDCSRYIWRLLRLIETRMLEPDPANRITAKELVAELQTLQHLTALSDSFYQKHWTETEHHRD